MGRELKRVPLDFDWPLDKAWKGYINPHYVQCAKCEGLGQSMAMSRLSDLVGLLMLSGDDAARGKAHPYFSNCGGLHNSFGGVCEKEMADLTASLAGRTPSSFGHDACDRWTATKKILAAAKMPDGWGSCVHCDGEGVEPDSLEAYNAWEDFDPPEGPGYQLWQTTSEGSPISPVFKTMGELCQWLEDTGASVFGSSTATAQRWRKMLDENFVRHEEGSMVFI